MQTNHDPVPIIHLNLKLIIMSRKFTHNVIMTVTWSTVGVLGLLSTFGILFSIFMFITDPTFRV